MNPKTIHIRNTRGDQALAQPGELAPGPAYILNAIDGKSTVEDLRARLAAHLSPEALDQGLEVLVSGKFIRDSAAPIPFGEPGFVDRRQADSGAQTEQQRRAEDLRAKLKARREGGERGALAVDAEDAQEAGRQVPGEDERTAREAAEHAAREAEQRARHAAEEQARQQAAELARRQAEEQARKLAEEAARRAAEEAARKAAEESRRAAEDKARREAEDAAREADERARQRAEVQARLMAEEQAWQEAEEKARREEEAKLREQAAATDAKAGKSGLKKPRKIGRTVALAAVALLVVGLAALHLISFGAQIPKFEQALSAQFGQPVRIKALHVALVPTPHLRLEGVSIGAQGQIAVPTIKAAGDLGNLFSEKKAFKAMDLDSPVISEEGLGWILFGAWQGNDMPFGQVRALNARFDSKRISLPELDAQMQFEANGAWKNIAIVSTDQNLELQFQAKGGAVQIEAKARSFKLPFGSTLTLEDFVASGTADRGGLNLSEFKGFALGGTVGGTARLKWGENWSLAGELNVKQIDTARVLPELMGSSRLAGTASYVMQGPDSAKLFASAHLEGSFTVPRGTLRGIDLGSVLQGGDIRGETKFEELAGNVVSDGGVIQLRQLRLAQANMSATGSADVDADGSVRGRVLAEIRLSTEQRRISLAVSGNTTRLEWKR